MAGELAVAPKACGLARRPSGRLRLPQRGERIRRAALRRSSIVVVIRREPLRYDAALLTRPPLTGIDVISGLEHFAIVTYAIPPARLRPLVHQRFDLDCIRGADGEPRALVSMVPFLDRDFRFARLPWLRFRFGQTNYRAYVIDRETGGRAVWFFGTTLDSWSVAVPHYLWKLPWHRGRTRFSCEYDAEAQRYSRYRVATRSDWGPARLELADTGVAADVLAGFADPDTAAVVLTHPLDGVFYRRDGALGAYRVWHDRLQLTSGRVVRAEIGLFDRLGLVPFAEQSAPHSVLIQPRTEFTIYLPPRKLAGRR
jgi:hypothetical protein